MRSLEAPVDWVVSAISVDRVVEIFLFCSVRRHCVDYICIFKFAGMNSRTKLEAVPKDYQHW